MDDDQLVNEPAATLADESKISEAEKPEGEEAKTETETKADDAGDPASDKAKEGEEDKEESEPKKKKLSGIERLKRRVEAAEAEAALLRSRSADGEVSAPELEKRIGKAPKEDEYKGDYLAYERALTAYELDKRQVTREMRGEIERAKVARSDRMRELVDEHQERIEEFRVTAKDFDAVMTGAAGLKVSPVVEELVIESDNSAHLQYFLAKNPRELSRLNAMSEREATREIGRIEAKLSLPQAKTTTSAPKPVTPPKGGASPKADPAKMSEAEYVKWRRAGNG